MFLINVIFYNLLVACHYHEPTNRETQRPIYILEKFNQKRAYFKTISFDKSFDLVTARVCCVGHYLTNVVVLYGQHTNNALFTKFTELTTVRSRLHGRTKINKYILHNPRTRYRFNVQAYTRRICKYFKFHPFHLATLYLPKTVLILKQPGMERPIDPLVQRHEFFPP